MGCESKRIPSTCISFDAREDQSKLIRDGAAKIAASRRMDFSDKSGQYPWPDLAIYIGLEGRGFHVIGHRETGYVGTLCFYEEKGIFGGEKAKEQMKLVQADFSVFFIDAKIPFEAGKPRSKTKSGTGGTPMGPPFVVLWLPGPAQVANASDFEKLLRAEFANFAKAQSLEFADSSVEQRQLQSKEHLVWLTAYEKRVSVLVDWGGDTLHPNMVAVNGDGSAERPRQIYEALVRHLRATNIPFTVKEGTVTVGSRSTQSSGNTMALPSDIKEQLLNYIDLEFGESRDHPGALQSSDLVYDGAFESSGTTRHYWHFAARGRPLWVTVTPVRDTFEISGFLTEGPVGSRVK